jgi:hypothetical protein
VKGYTIRLQLLQRCERIGGGAERAVEPGRDDDVALTGAGKQALAFRPLRKRHRPAHPAFDEEIGRSPCPSSSHSQ